jgi:hypothetical protein
VRRRVNSQREWKSCRENVAASRLNDVGLHVMNAYRRVTTIPSPIDAGKTHLSVSVLDPLLARINGGTRRSNIPNDETRLVAAAARRLAEGLANDTETYAREPARTEAESQTTEIKRPRSIGRNSRLRPAKPAPTPANPANPSESSANNEMASSGVIVSSAA